MMYTTSILFLSIYYSYCLVQAFQFNNKHGNKHQILSSVYDVIKFNQNPDKNEKMMDMSEEKATTPSEPIRRHSFEDYEYVEMPDYAVAESNHENSHHHKPHYHHHHHHEKHKELVCYHHHDKHHHHHSKVHDVDDSIWHKLSSKTFTLFKFLAILVGSFVAPVVLLKILMLPLKIIALLKFFALVNTVLIGSFLYRFFFRRGFDIFKSGWKNVKSNFQNNKRPEQLLEQLVNNKGNSSELDDNDIQLILKYIKKKNKDW